MAILLTYWTARLLLAGDAEAREEYMANDPYTGPLTVSKSGSMSVVVKVPHHRHLLQPYCNQADTD